jgi:hypothetical protein
MCENHTCLNFQTRYAMSPINPTAPTTIDNIEYYAREPVSFSDDISAVKHLLPAHVVPKLQSELFSHDLTQILFSKHTVPIGQFTQLVFEIPLPQLVTTSTWATSELSRSSVSAHTVRLDRHPIPPTCSDATVRSTREPLSINNIQYGSKHGALGCNCLYPTDVSSNALLTTLSIRTSLYIQRHRGS